MLPEAAGKALSVALWAAFLIQALVYVHVLSSGHFLLPGTIFAAVFLVLLWKNRPALEECARQFDGPGKGKDFVLNAFELISRNAPDSPFAEYAVVRGIEALVASDRHPSHIAVPWRKALFPFMLFLGLLLLPPAKFSSGSEAKKTGKRKNAVENIAPPLLSGMSPSLPEVRIRPSESGKAGGRSGFFSKNGFTNDPGPRGGEVSGGNLRSSASGGTGSGESGPGSKKGQEEEKSDPETDGAPGKNTNGKSFGRGTSGSGEVSEEDENALKSTLGAGASGAARGRNARERRKKSVNRRKEPSRGGFQMLPADKAPPASRKLADKEEHGDEPGTGRGGETGAKKSRGAAAALPVIPQPDSVAGRIGSGEDVTSVENGTNSRRPGKTEVLSFPDADEEPGPSRSAPARIRLSVRRIFDDNVLQRAR